MSPAHEAFARQRHVSAVHGVQRSDSREKWEDSSDSDQDPDENQSQKSDKEEGLPYPIE